jgi:hypothetical protein
LVLAPETLALKAEIDRIEGIHCLWEKVKAPVTSFIGPLNASILTVMLGDSTDFQNGATLPYLCWFRKNTAVAAKSDYSG